MRLRHAEPCQTQSGFALVITLILLAILVLAVYALSALVKVDGQVSVTGAFQTQARQNALLGLNVGIGDLQRLAGGDDAITGMAGIAGVTANQNSTTRYWCGVWQSDGSFAAWLASGASSSASVATPSVELISSGTVGTASSTSANVEKEHVIAGKIPILVSETVNAPGVPTTVGNYAYLVTDEGGKISAYAPLGQQPIPNVPPRISSGMLTNQLKLKTAIENNAGRLPGVISYEQLALLPTPVLTPSVLQDTFHYVTLTARTVSGSGYLAGTLNINTASTLVWRNLLETYNAVPGVVLIPAANITAKGNAIGNGFAAANLGKAINGPFTTVGALGAYLDVSFPATGSPTAAQIIAALAPMLTVRSDVFRVRAYGDAVNPANATKVEAMACCEAIVQRTPDVIDATLGRRFVITYFRWLGPDDI